MLPPMVPKPPPTPAATLFPYTTLFRSGVATVVRVGVAWLTTLVSPGSLQAVAIAALLVSRLWLAFHCWVPAWLGANGSEVAVPVPPPELTTALVLVKIDALPQGASFGP